jgi:peptidoglycan biosynthesis protein MviN/MurJ (putative lipid II flippase)
MVPPDFRYDCFSEDEADTRRGSRSAWTPFLAGVVWLLVPLCLGVAVASRRDESVVIAAVLTVLLGWIGFVLVYVFLRSRRRDDAMLRGPD